MPVAPGHGIPGEGAVGDNDGVISPVHRACRSLHGVHDGGSHFPTDASVLGLYDDPAVAHIIADDVGRLIATASDAACHPAVTDQQVPQRALELLVVHGVELDQGDPQRGKPLGVTPPTMHSAGDSEGADGSHHQGKDQEKRPRVLESFDHRGRHLEYQNQGGECHDSGREYLRRAAWASYPHTAHQREADDETAGCGCDGVVSAVSPNPNTCPHNQMPASSPAIVQPLIRFALPRLGLRRMCPRT